MAESVNQASVNPMAIPAKSMRNVNLSNCSTTPRQMTLSKIESAKKLLANGIPAKEVANNLGVSVPTLYRWVPAST
jgi:hypothetical protein